MVNQSVVENTGDPTELGSVFPVSCAVVLQHGKSIHVALVLMTARVDA